MHRCPSGGIRRHMRARAFPSASQNPAWVQPCELRYTSCDRKSPDKLPGRPLRLEPTARIPRFPSARFRGKHSEFLRAEREYNRQGNSPKRILDALPRPEVNCETLVLARIG